ncbi:TonB-dependent siderophore receptor [Microbulbifer sp. JMSA003]|uniref:TonB-dependent siderophore receptor n=1 Tax=Microbulbifer sp. JMSA003 TaxID=3243369 RepID=UPI00403A61F5
MSTARIKSMQKASPVISGISRSLLALAIAAGGSSVAFAADDKNEGIEEISVIGDLNLDRQTSIGKLDVPVDETPFSISLRNRDFMDLTGTKQIQDVLQYVAGVNGGTFGVDARGDWSTVRGVQPTMFIDGLQSIFGSYNSARANSYAFESVEVLKGPSSVLYGQGSTGGIVNMVSKRPQSDFGGEVMVQGGDYDRKVVAADVTGAMDSEGKWLYRVVGYTRDADAQVEHVEDNSTLFMPSISWRPSDDTEITFLANYQKDESGTTTAFLPWGGTIVENENGDIPTDVFLSEPGWDRYDTEQVAYSLWFDHSFSENWGMNASIRYSEGDVDYHTMFADFSPFSDQREDANIRDVSRTIYMTDSSSDFLIFDLRFSGEITTGPFEHQVSFGLDSQDASTGTDGLYLPGWGGTIDIFDPTYGYVPYGMTSLSDLEQVPAEYWIKRRTETEQLGFYFQDQISLANWIFTTGVRRDSTESETLRGSTDDDATTVRFGAMYAFDMGVSPYISYSESFEPVMGSDRLDRPFEPVEGEQVEVGLKYQPESTNILITASAFEIKQKNLLAQDPLDPNYDTQIGEAKLHGFELEAAGQIGDLQIVANYSSLDLDDQIVAVPEEQMSVWGNYDLGLLLPGLSAGVGVRYVGESYNGEDINGILPANNPSYTLYDATIGYTLDSWKFQLNAKNLTDEVHTTACLSRGDCYYGERRYVTAEARYIF